MRRWYGSSSIALAVTLLGCGGNNNGVGGTVQFTASGEGPLMMKTFPELPSECPASASGVMKDMTRDWKDADLGFLTISGSAQAAWVGPNTLGRVNTRLARIPASWARRTRPAAG